MAIKELLSQITPINLGPIYDVKNLVTDVLVSASLRGHKSDKEETKCLVFLSNFLHARTGKKECIVCGKRIVA